MLRIIFKVTRIDSDSKIWMFSSLGVKADPRVSSWQENPRKDRGRWTIHVTCICSAPGARAAAGLSLGRRGQGGLGRVGRWVLLYGEWVKGDAGQTD